MEGSIKLELIKYSFDDDNDDDDDDNDGVDDDDDSFSRRSGIAVFWTGNTGLGLSCNSSIDRSRLKRSFPPSESESPALNVTVDVILVKSPGLLPETKIVTRLVEGARTAGSGSGAWVCSTLMAPS